jgi:hypothetical protein
VPRRASASALNTNGDKTLHVPGVYRHVLRKLCERDALAAAPGYLLLADSEAADAWKRELQARIHALMAERNGNRLVAHASHLPDGLPPPFEAALRGADASCITTTEKPGRM